MGTDEESPFDMPDLEEVERGLDFDEDVAEDRPSESESPFDSPPVTRLPLDDPPTE